MPTNDLISRKINAGCHCASLGRRNLLLGTLVLSQTRKIATLRAAFFSSCGGLQPSAATVGPFGPSQDHFSGNVLNLDFFHQNFFLLQKVLESSGKEQACPPAGSGDGARKIVTKEEKEKKEDVEYSMY